MNTKSQAREIAMRLEFALSYHTDSDITEQINELLAPNVFSDFSQDDSLFAEFPDNNLLTYIRRILTLIEENKNTIDETINRYSSKWKISRISKTALAIIRCAACEILYMPEIPDAVAVNEAVEMAKKYDTAETVSFVNGILGGIIRGEKVSG